MASPPVLAFDAEGRPLKLETWLDDLHLFLQLTAKEDISLYDHALGHAPAPAASADSTPRSQWQTRDAHARFAIRNSLPIDEREHFGQHKTAQALYTAVVARYSSSASAALCRLSLPYLFPDLASFHTVGDLITHLRTSEARFRAAIPDEFLAKNPPPLWLTLYHLVTRLPDTLRSVRDHFLARCPIELTIALLEKELLAAEASIVAVGASRGDPRTPFFEGCSPSPLLPSVASAAAVDLLGAEKVGTASAAPRAKGARAVAVTAGEAVVGAVVAVGVVARLEGLVAAVGVVAAAAGEVAGAEAVVGVAVDAAAAGVGVVEEVAAAVVVVKARAVARASSTLRRPRRSVSRTLSTGGGGGGGGGFSCKYVIRTGDRTGQPCGGPHATQRCFARLNDAWRVQFPQATELPRWVDLLKKGIDIYALDFDAILTAMYVMSTSGVGAEYLCVPPDPGIRTSASAAPGTRVFAAPGAGEAAALGACASASPGTESTAALHTFTLDSGASRCIFRDRTSLEPLARPVALSLADLSGGPVIATSSTVLPCPAVPLGTLSGLHLPSFSTNLVAGSALQDGGVHQFTPAYERVAHCTCARTGRHLATFTRQSGSDLYTLTTESPQVAASASASASGQLSAPCSCRSLAHETVLWHHRLGHPSVQRLRAMHSRYLVSGLPRRAAPHSSSFPPTTAPLQTLHMDVWGPARVRGQGQERYFLIVVDDYSRYTTVFPLRTKAQPLAPCLLAGDLAHTAVDGGGWRCVAFPDAAVVDPLPPQGAAPSGVSQLDPVEPFEVAVDSRPAVGAEPGGAEPGGAEPGGAEPGGAEPGGAEPGGAEPGGAEPGGADPWGAEPGGDEPGSTEPGGAEPQSPESGGSESGGPEPEGPTPGGALSSERLREWYFQYCGLRRGTSGARRTTGTGASASPPSRELPSRERIREWYERRCTLRSGAPGVADPTAAAGATCAGDSTGSAGAAAPEVGAVSGGADPGVGATGGAADPGAGAAAYAEDPGVGAAAGTEDPGVGAAAGAEDP
ncbi:unnamed protein product [Closterium sp. NIES-64]|nr:unnamed protein product [Closterium sp. NIES-64]